MQLGELIQGVPGAVLSEPVSGETDISSLSRDTRTIDNGTLFCCVVGEHVDGHDIADEAVAKGAVALLVERPVQKSVPEILVKDVRQSLAYLAAQFYGHPEKQMKMFGITGTNGKTTTAHLLAKIVERNKWSGEILGTLHGKRTTPDALDLFAQLKDWAEKNISAVTMEVSSHALAQGRVNGICFDLAIFTNLSQDHLDYHKTMEEYFRAKALLFTPEHSSLAVINGDDEYGQRLISNSAVETISYSIDDAVNISYGVRETTFGWNGELLSTALPGEHNVYNVLAAATAAKAIGIDTKIISEGIAAVEVVPGRMERVDEGQPFLVFVDYAHTPDGLERVLTTTQRYAQARGGRTISVFGCGGDRDAAKRPQMGGIAMRLSDVAYLTSDNPRSEDPNAIISDVVAGIEEKSNLVIESNRHLAIQMAIRDAKAQDVVIITGKGHESGQEANGIVTPFDDREEARTAIHSLGVNA